MECSRTVSTIAPTTSRDGESAYRFWSTVHPFVHYLPLAALLRRPWNALCGDAKSQPSQPSAQIVFLRTKLTPRGGQ